MALPLNDSDALKVFVTHDAVSLSVPCGFKAQHLGHVMY